MAEFFGSGTSSLELNRTSKGEYTWAFKIYFSDNTNRGTIAVIDSIMTCKEYIEGKLGQGPEVEASAGFTGTESGGGIFEHLQDLLGKIDEEEKRVLSVDRQVRVIERLMDRIENMEERIKRLETKKASKPRRAKAEGKTGHSEAASIPISEPEEKEKAGKPESEKA